jgi:hypothetical protein
MLKYTEKTQKTYIQSLTVSELRTIEYCGLPSSPRTIGVSWQSYLCANIYLVFYCMRIVAVAPTVGWDGILVWCDISRLFYGLRHVRRGL